MLCLLLRPVRHLCWQVRDAGCGVLGMDAWIRSWCVLHMWLVRVVHVAGACTAFGPSARHDWWGAAGIYQGGPSFVFELRVHKLI